MLTEIQKKRKTDLQRQRQQQYKSSGHGNPAFLKWKYGLTLTEILKQKEKQQNLCAICKKEMKSSLDCCVDHCHTTKKFRGLLCRKCNIGLGMFGDKLELIEKAKEYLLCS